MKEPIEVMEMLTRRLSKEMLEAHENPENEVDIRLSTSFVRLYFEMLDIGDDLAEEFETALEALDDYAFFMSQSGHAGYTNLIVRMTVLMKRLDSQKIKDTSASGMTTRQMELFLFGENGPPDPKEKNGR